MLRQECNGVLNRLDFLSGVVGNFAAEFLFERHDQFDGIQAVSTQIVDETGIVRHLCLVYAKVLDNDFLYPVRNVAHL